jgi:hypothetical protein
MSPPHIPKIGATTVPPAASPKAGGQGAGSRQREPEAQAAAQAVERSVVVSRSIELLETMAGQVSKTTGESLDVSKPTQGAEADSGYRMQLMSFIVGSLSKAATAFRQQAAEVEEQPEAEEPELPVEEQAEEQVEAALPEQPMQEPGAVEPEQAVQEPLTTAYGSQGRAVQEQAGEGSLSRKA